MSPPELPDGAVPSRRNELHVFSANNGHTLSADCWCEPYELIWMKNKHGIPVLVVDHPDLIPSVIHHQQLQALRYMRPNWIDTVIASLQLEGSI